jgi:hypothetical protein
MCKEPLGLGRHYWGEIDCPYFEPLRVPSSIEEHTRELEEYWKDIKDIPTGHQPEDPIKKHRRWLQEDHDLAMDYKQKD